MKTLPRRRWARRLALGCTAAAGLVMFAAGPAAADHKHRHRHGHHDNYAYGYYVVPPPQVIYVQPRPVYVAPPPPPVIYYEPAPVIYGPPQINLVFPLDLD